MKARNLHIVALLCSVLAGAPGTATLAVAQPVIRPSITYEFGVPLSIDRSEGAINHYHFAGAGTSRNHATSFGAETVLPEAFPHIDAVLGLGLELSVGRFDSEPFESTGGIDPTRGGGVLVQSTFGVRASTSSLRLELLAERELADILSLAGGLWGSFRLSSAYFQTVQILEPQWAVYSDGSRERTVASGENIGGTLVRGGPLVRFGARVGIGRLSLRPSIHTRADAEAIARGLGLRALSAGAGVSLEVTPSARSETPRATESAMAPRAELHFTCGGSPLESCRVGAELVQHRAFLALHPFVLFDLDSTGLPARYVPNEPMSSIDPRHLVSGSARRLNEMLLNIVAGRMIRSGDTVTLAAAGPGSFGDEGMRRCAAVQRLLVLLGVPSAQITIGAAMGTRVPDPIVVLSGSQALLAPYTAEWIERREALPRIALDRTMSAAAGIRSWEIRIAHGERTIATYSSATSSSQGLLELGIGVPADGASAIDPLIASLEVIDETGGRSEARDTLMIEPSIEPGADADRMLHFMLIAPAGLDAISETANRGIIATIAALTGGGARVDVSTESAERLAPVVEEVTRALHEKGVEISALTSGVRGSASGLLLQSTRVRVENSGGTAE